MKLTKFARTNFCHYVTMCLVWMLFNLVPGPETRGAGGPVPDSAAVHLDSKGAPSTDPHPDMVTACGPICALILVLLILGVAVYMIVKLIQWCKKLNKKQSKPDDPNGNSNVPPGPASVQKFFTKSANNSSSGPVITLADTNSPMAWDITDWTTNGVPGLPGSPYHDTDGNPYCIQFKMAIQSCTNLAQPCWETACEVQGYVSFTSTNALTWSGPENGGTYNFDGTNAPQNIKMLWYTNGIASNHVAAVTYDKMPAPSPYGATLNTGTTIPDGVAGRNEQARFFRLVFPQE